MKRLILALLSFPMALFAAQPANSMVPPCIHPQIGSASALPGAPFRLVLEGRKQCYLESQTETLDRDINSPKSVNVHPDGSKYYVNSLEGYDTVVYDVKTDRKLGKIGHHFDAAQTSLWAKPSGLFPFRHYENNLNTFSGKPVESAFSHEGRYLWVPYYRRSYDVNAEDPSALAIIDTRTDSIVRMMETGPLPKMIAASPDGRFMAVSHWGDNTVALIDISSSTPEDWKYDKLISLGGQMKLDFGKEKVNRDTNCGNCLRGTVFTPDSRYLLVGAMGGRGGIGVIDMTNRDFLGFVDGTMRNLRHLVIDNGWLYASINRYGYIQRIRLDDFLSSLKNIRDGSVLKGGWQNVFVGTGTRTIAITPDGKYILAACNWASEISIVDATSYKLVGKLPVDSYPVGLAISKDGKRAYVTSQGRAGIGGLAVDILRIERND